MKFSGGDAEILGGGDTLLLSACGWAGGAAPVVDHFLLDNKLDAAAAGAGSDHDDSSAKATMDALDSLLQASPPSSAGGQPGGATSPGSFAELKPLPPFTGYTGHLSINGISGHHFHAIAAGPSSPQSPQLPEANNNNAHATNHNTATSFKQQQQHQQHPHQQQPPSQQQVQPGGRPTSSSGVTGATLYYAVSTTADQPVVSSSTASVGGVVNIKEEFIDYSSLMGGPDIEDIAALIGSAIADTTVPSTVATPDDTAGSRESWMEFDAWIDTACSGEAKPVISAESLQEFVQQQQQQSQFEGSSALQSLLSCQYQSSAAMLQHMLKRDTSAAAASVGYHMPLLQNRLQNGPPNGSVKAETYLEAPSSSTQYLAHTTTGSPPGVVSTTDTALLINGSRYGGGGGMGVARPAPGPGSASAAAAAAAAAARIGFASHLPPRPLKTAPSPDLLVNGGSLDSLAGAVFPHTTTATTTTPAPSKSKSRNRSRSKQQCGVGAPGAAAAGVVYSGDPAAAAVLGKEKPVHRCSICNRGFLNKSNIKVHLRTHTGEKPFRCEVCGKAFRQKAHLIKHQQIHKRVGRD
ncbi:ichor [Schistocerca cancellata]|uniref:ichor n=1 Tax=Schistocerca cancellata TaxID=274614 RepID=UPI002117BC8F|nr:ichor [Schistocerca cancellata]